MKYFAIAAFVTCLTLSPACFASIDDDLGDGDWHSSILNFSLGVSVYEMKLLGDTPATIFPGAPDDWDVEGGDLNISITGKAPTHGHFYGGGGATFLFGLADDEYEGTTTFVNERYGHVGVDLFVELGFRLPVGSAYHLDMGGRLGGTVDYAWGSDTAFSYYHAHLWYGPVVTFEPNGGNAGLFVSGSLRLPAVGSFGIEDIGLDDSFNTSSGYIGRVEAGFIFPNGFALAGFYETGGFEYEDDATDESFDQDISTIGIQLSLTK